MTPDTLDTTWYMSIDGQQQGPLHRTEVAAAYKDGRLKPTDFVWHAALGDWVTAREVMAPPPAQQPPPAPLPPPAAPQAPTQSLPQPPVTAAAPCA